MASSKSIKQITSNQWTVPQLSIIIIYNSTWPMFVINRITLTMEYSKSGRRLKLCGTMHFVLLGYCAIRTFCIVQFLYKCAFAIFARTYQFGYIKVFYVVYCCYFALVLAYSRYVNIAKSSATRIELS